MHRYIIILLIGLLLRNSHFIYAGPKTELRQIPLSMEALNV